MRRALVGTALFVLGCEAGTNDAADAGADRVDVGLTLGDRQRVALGRWAQELSREEAVMRQSVAYYRGGGLDPDHIEEWDAAARAFREISTAGVPDAGEPFQALVRDIDRMITVVAPAYCRLLAAYRAVTHLSIVDPTVRCDELPPRFEWWTRFEGR